MKVALYVSDSRYDSRLIPPLARGFKRHGIKFEYVKPTPAPIVPEWADLAAFVGVKSLGIYSACKIAGVQTLLIDKGYFNRLSHFKMALGGFQPSYLGVLESMGLSDARLREMGVTLRPQASGGDLVVFAGGSQKFHNWHGSGDVHKYAMEVCAQLRALGGDKKIIYRPKPSWWTKIPLKEQSSRVPPGVALSPPNELLQALLPRTYCLVTYGSNAAVEALTWGVPVIVTSPEGASAVHSIAETEIKNLRNPYYSEERRAPLMAALSWCQFSEVEIASGFAWDTIKNHARIASK